MEMVHNMDIRDSFLYLCEKKWQKSRLGLERMEELLSRLGNPQKKLKLVHVAGTNGKGSTSAMIASILQEAGYRVGLYTSPYLKCFNERIQVNREPISDLSICRIVEKIRPEIDAMDDHPTEFEMITTIGFMYFLEQQCDIVVLEVGMGGEYDATNIIDCPETAVITNIGLDHTRELGHTISEIAWTKSGIIKQNCDVVCYEQTEEALARINERCRQTNSRIACADFSELKEISHSLKGQMFDYKDIRGIELSLLGKNQLRNAAVAIEAVRVMSIKQWKVSDSDILNGLKNTVWAGRFEVIQQNPLVIVDGGHNPQCIEALKLNICDYLEGKRLIFLVGVLSDKDYNTMFKDIAEYADALVTVTPDNPRALPANELTEILRVYKEPVYTADTIPEGLEMAKKLAGTDGVVCAFGSLYMIGSLYGCI